NDFVEMSSMQTHENITSEFDFKPLIDRDDDEIIDNVDERDTANLTKNRVDQNLEKEETEEGNPPVNDKRETSDSIRSIHVSSLKHSKSLGRMSDMISSASTRVV